MKQKGENVALGEHVFDYGQKGSADQLRTTWEKIVNHTGATLGHDICNELRNKKKLIIVQSGYPQEVLDQHQSNIERHQKQQKKLLLSMETKRKKLQEAIADGDEIHAPLHLTILENEIEDAECEASVEPPIKVTEEQKTDYNLARKNCDARITQLENHRGKAYSTIYGQCMPILPNK